MTSLSNMLCAFGPASRPNIRIFGNSLKKFQHTSCGKHFWDQLEWTQIVKTEQQLMIEMSTIKVENVDQRTIGNCAKRGGGGSRSALEGTTRKGGKKHEKLLSAPSFSKFCLSRALSALKLWRPRRCSEYTNYHHIKCKIVPLFSKKLWKKTSLRKSQL